MLSSIPISRTLRPALFAALAIASMAGAITGIAASLNPHLRYRQAMGRAGISAPAPKNNKTTAPAADNTHEEPTYLPVIIKLDSDDAPVPEFVHELHRRKNLVLAQVPEERISELALYRHVTRVESQPSAIPVMDRARTFCNLPAATASYSPLPLTGTGVVTGFCDIGFDPAHINFLDENGESRVKKIVSYSLDHPYPEILDTADEIMGWGTDNPDETHATHVCGIMSGSYMDGNLQGIATEADIVATTSPLYDAYLLAGCEQIIEYAQSVGKPAVVNMSIASETGPHDGTTLFNRYMEMLTEDAAVCISAGNSGSRNCYINRIFTTEHPTFRTYPRQWPTWSPLEAHGIIDIWCSDNQPVSVDVVGWSESLGDIAYRWPGEMLLEPGKDAVICSPDLADKFPDHADPLLPSRFSGYIYMTAEVNPENDRYNVSFICDIKDVTTTDHYAAEYRFGPEITGQPGQEVDVYASSAIFFLSPPDPLATNGNSGGSVNDLCTGENVICVGAMTSRNTWPMLNGETEKSDKLTIGTPAYFSSYGTLRNGKRLPHFCAPGATVVSSISSPYVAAHPEIINLACAASDVAGETYYWKNDQGTSMSSPFAAGVIALWLQANPDLTGEEVREIAYSSVTAPAKEAASRQWGGGMLDAAAGLAKAREMASTDNPLQQISDMQAGISVKRTGPGTLAFTWGNRELTAIRVVDMAGREILAQKYPRGQHSVELNCESLQQSVYVAEITSANGEKAIHKFAVSCQRQ